MNRMFQVISTALIEPRRRGGASLLPLIWSKEFRDFLQTGDLMDLGFVNPRFTWCNNHRDGARVWERIDKTYVTAS